MFLRQQVCRGPATHECEPLCEPPECVTTCSAILSTSGVRRTVGILGVTVLESVKLVHHNLQGCRFHAVVRSVHVCAVMCCLRFLADAVRNSLWRTFVCPIAALRGLECPAKVTLCSRMIRNRRPGAVVCPQTECEGSDCSRAVACQTVRVPHEFHECLGECISDCWPFEVQPPCLHDILCGQLPDIVCDAQVADLKIAISVLRSPVREVLGSFGSPGANGDASQPLLARNLRVRSAVQTWARSSERRGGGGRYQPNPHIRSSHHDCRLCGEHGARQCYCVNLGGCPFSKNVRHDFKTAPPCFPLTRHVFLPRVGGVLFTEAVALTLEARAQLEASLSKQGKALQGPG